VEQGSVTRWITQLRAGDQAAADPLWDRYFDRLVALARARLLKASRRAADEEDVALSAFHSFCRAAERGRFPKLDDREDLWRLLVCFITRKAAHFLRDRGRLKRRGRTGHDLYFRCRNDEIDLELIAAEEPSPDFVAEMADEYRRLMGRLGDETLRSVAVWKMEGYTNEEIAGKLQCVSRTVERKLRLIRAIWESEL
jgi:DNA-directed RNA polymerase specialized sigma24 family protein